MNSDIWMMTLWVLVAVPWYLYFLTRVCSRAWFKSKLDYQRAFFTNFSTEEYKVNV